MLNTTRFSGTSNWMSDALSVVNFNPSSGGQSRQLSEL